MLSYIFTDMTQMLLLILHHMWSQEALSTLLLPAEHWTLHCLKLRFVSLWKCVCVPDMSFTTTLTPLLYVKLHIPHRERERESQTTLIWFSWSWSKWKLKISHQLDATRFSKNREVEIMSNSEKIAQLPAREFFSLPTRLFLVHWDLIHVHWYQSGLRSLLSAQISKAWE